MSSSFFVLFLILPTVVPNGPGPTIIDSRTTALATESLRSCNSCFWLFTCCTPILCTILWLLNVLLVFITLRYCASLCVPEKRKPCAVTSTPRISQEDSTVDETSYLLTPIPLTPFFVDRRV